MYVTDHSFSFFSIALIMWTPQMHLVTIGDPTHLTDRGLTSNIFVIFLTIIILHKHLSISFAAAYYIGGFELSFFLGRNY